MSKNKNLKKYIWLAALFCVLQQGNTQHLLLLDTILNRIDRNHPQLKSFESRVLELNTYATGARTLPPPQVSTGFWMTPYNPGRWSQSSVYGDAMGSYMVSAQQMFPNRSMNIAEQAYMASMAGMEVAEKGVMRNMLFAEAKAAFYKWMVLKKKLAVLEESKTVLNLIIESAKERYKYNREKLGSIYKAELELSDLDRMKAMLQGEILQQKTMLEALMQYRMADDSNSILNDSFDIDTSGWKIPPIPVEPDTTLIDLRSDIRAVGQQLVISRLDQEWQKSKLNPEFGLRFDHMFTFGGQPGQFSLMGMMTVPIAPWANKDIKARIKGIDYRLEAFEWEKAALANQIRGALSDRLVMMQTLHEQLLRYENEIIPNQRKRFQSTLLAYEQNTDELFMTLDAWLELKMSRLSQLDLLQQLLQANVAYEKELEKR